jgi:elongation factor 2
MGRYVEAVEDVPCGNTVALLGVDQDLVKTGTITDSELAHNIRVMKFSVSPVVRIAVECVNAADLPKLKEGLVRLSKSDPLVQVIADSGKTILAGAGELHLEICIKDLREFCGNIELRTSEPVVPYRESVSALSPEPVLAKTANKLNRLYLTAQPINKEAEAIDKGDLKTEGDEKAIARQLSDEFGWDVNEARKIWSFGPEPQPGTNVIVDTSRAVDYLNEARELIVNGFLQNVTKGPLAEEPLRAVRFNLTDAMLHSESNHRSTSQILPAVRRAMFGSVLTASPVVLEPVFAVDIQCPDTAIGGIFGVLNRRRGHVISQEQRPGTPLYSVKAFLPVMESFGFTEDLRSATHGQAFPQCVFDHWQVLPGDPLTPGSKAFEVVMAIRKRKGLKEAIPTKDQFIDRL